MRQRNFDGQPLPPNSRPLKFVEWLDMAKQYGIRNTDGRKCRNMEIRKYGNMEIWFCQTSPSACLVCGCTKLSWTVCSSSSLYLKFDDPFDLQLGSETAVALVYGNTEIRKFRNTGIRKSRNTEIQEYGFMDFDKWPRPPNSRSSCINLLRSLVFVERLDMVTWYGIRKYRNTEIRKYGNTHLWSYGHSEGDWSTWRIDKIVSSFIWSYLATHKLPNHRYPASRWCADLIPYGIRKYKNTKTRKYGNTEIQKYGNTGIWVSGAMRQRIFDG